jgi:hypothetical protein
MASLQSTKMELVARGDHRIDVEVIGPSGGFPQRVWHSAKRGDEIQHHTLVE